MPMCFLDMRGGLAQSAYSLCRREGLTAVGRGPPAWDARMRERWSGSASSLPMAASQARAHSEALDESRLGGSDAQEGADAG